MLLVRQRVLDPEKYPEEAAELRQHSSLDDTYREVIDGLPQTLFLLSEGVELDEPFPQMDFRKPSDGSPC